MKSKTPRSIDQNADESAASPVKAASEADSRWYREITLGESLIRLDFEFGALVAGEKFYNRQGHQVNLLFCLDVSTLNLGRVQQLFAAATRTWQPELTYAEAIGMVKAENFYAIANVCFDVLAPYLNGTAEAAA